MSAEFDETSGWGSEHQVPAEAERLIAVGQEKLAEGDLEGAVEDFRAVVAQFPELPHGYGLLSTTLLVLEEFEEAVAPLEKLRELMPELAATRLLLARAYLEVERVTEAEHEIEQVVKNNPNSAEGHLILAELYTRTGRFPEAVKEAKRATEIAPEAENFFGLAETYLAADDVERAIKAADQAVIRDETHPGAHMVLAEAYAARQEWELVANEAARAQELEPDAVDATYLLGVALLNLGQAPEAEELAEEALDEGMEDPEVFTLLAQAQMAQTHFEDALETLDEGLELFPDSPDLLFSKGLAQLGLGQVSEAEATMSAVRERDPELASELAQLIRGTERD